MATNNYTTMSNVELLTFIKNLNIGIKQLQKYLKRHYPTLFIEIKNRTNFLNEALNITITERLFCIEHNLNSSPKCKNQNCNHQVKWDRKTQKYRTHCCGKCAQEDIEVKQKRENTFIQTIGVKSPLLLESTKQKIQSQQTKDKRDSTMEKLYGVRNALQSTIIKSKQVNTMVQNHGVVSASQLSGFFSNCKKSYVNPKYPTITFGSSWEFKVYDFLTEHGIEFEYQPKLVLSYMFENKLHTYHPDFQLSSGQIVEVKGDQFFRLNKSTGNEEMCIPSWCRKTMSEEEYEHRCQLAQAKHECMIKHNVIILRQNQIKNLSLSMFFISIGDSFSSKTVKQSF